MSELMVRESELPTISNPEQWALRRTAFNGWVNTQLKKGVDFGEIPGTDKPTLLKPGAEKIAQAYGCSPISEVTLRDQNPETGYLYVEVTVRLVSIQTGAVVSTGIGACSSYESKYRWRWEWWNGRNAPPADAGYEQTRNGKWRRRIPNADLIDVWNTVLKMAKKRALVDAALTVSGASEKFTQDIEDMDDAPTTSAAPQTIDQPQRAESRPEPRREDSRREEAPPANGRPWSADQAVALVRSSATSRVQNGKATNDPAESKLRNAVVARIGELFPRDAKELVDMKRHALVYGLFGGKSIGDLTDAECRALLAWASEQDSDGEWHVHPSAIIEADRVVVSVDAEFGQKPLM